MKKLICALLALLMMCSALVACDDDINSQANEELKDFGYVPPVVEEKTLDFYIVCGDETVENAKQTVSNKIKDEFERLYKTSVVMHYISADEYKETVLAENTREKFLNAEEEKASIVLINSKELYDELDNRGLLLNLYDSYSMKEFGSLKKQLANLLPLTYGEKTVTVYDNEGNPTGTEVVSTSYLVPNNYAYGQYKYIYINRDMVQFCNETKAAVECDSVEKAQALASRFAEHVSSSAAVQQYLAELGLEVDEIVKIGVEGYPGDRVAAEEDWYCVEIEAPTPTIDNVYESAFAVVGYGSLAYRAMQIIYKINTDPYFRNLLQYGVEGLNFRKTIESGVTIATPIISEQATYSMSLKYTGDIYTSYHCDTVCLACAGNDVCANGEHVYWTPDNKVTCSTWVEYNFNGGAFEGDFVPVSGISSGTLSLTGDYIPTRVEVIPTQEDGVTYAYVYEFGGWYKDEAMTSTNKISNIGINSGAITLYAKWNEKIKVEWTAEDTCDTWIEYELNGGEFAEDFIPVSGIITELNLDSSYVPTKASQTIDGKTVNYTFGGWYAADDFSEATRVETVKTGRYKVILYAKWIETVAGADDAM